MFDSWLHNYGSIYYPEFFEHNNVFTRKGNGLIGKAHALGAWDCRIVPGLPYKSK